MRQARDGPYWVGFEKAIETEFKTLEENETWEYRNLKDIPRSKNILNSKFVFTLKECRRRILKIQARLVAMGFTSKIPS